MLDKSFYYKLSKEEKKAETFQSVVQKKMVQVGNKDCESSSVQKS